MAAWTLLVLPAIGQENRPLVKAGELPAYPAIAQQARIEGTVVLKITTDGSAIGKVEVVSGHPMLVGSAASAVKKWQFEQHPATSFEMSIDFKFADDDIEINSVSKQIIAGHAIPRKLNVETPAPSITVTIVCYGGKPPSRCSEDGKPVPCDLLLKSGLNQSSLRRTK